MTAQVITPANHVEFITTGKVAEFKPPEAAKEPTTEVKPEAVTAPVDAKAKADATDQPSTEKPRGEDGKFKKAGEPAADADPEDAELTEKVRKIIAKKHRQMKEAEEFATGEGRRALQAERRAAELQREIEALRSGKSDGPSQARNEGSDPDEPKQGDFKTVGEYTRALVKYEAEKAGKQGKAQAEQARQQSEAQAAIATYVERQDAFREATPDYDDVVGAADVEMHPAAMQYLVESEMGPQLAYHLAKNPGEITRLKKLSPSRLVAELGKLEMKLEAPKAAPATAAAKEAPQVSKAPAPIQALEGKTTTVTKDPSQMNFAELREHRRKEEMAKRAAGR